MSSQNETEEKEVGEVGQRRVMGLTQKVMQLVQEAKHSARRPGRLPLLES